MAEFLTGTNEQTKGYFGVLATLVLLIVLLLVIFPAVKHITQINKEISDARVVKKKLEVKLEALDQAKTSLAQVSSDLPLLDLALPVGSEMPRHLARIEKLSSDNKMAIFGAQFDNVPLSKPSVQEADLKTKDFAFTVTWTGEFGDFRKLLTQLESLIRISDVKTLEISKEEGEPIKHILGITSYFLGTGFDKEKLNTQGAGSNESQTGTLPNE